MEINGTKIKKGEQKLVKLSIARLPSHTMIDVPVYIYRSEKEGPVLLLMAGLHGDEVNGVEIIRRMITDRKTIPKIGTVIAVPILNVFGFLNFARYVPDGKDVNRSFPGTLKGSLASRVAYHFMNDIFPVIDLGVDFHTGGASRANFPQIRCAMEEPLNEELARAFAPPFIIDAKMRDKSLRKEAHKNGKSIIVYEGGESMRFNEDVIEEGIRGTLRLMRHLGMTDTSEPVEHDTIVIKKSTWRRATRSGLFRFFIKNGDEIRKNQLLASTSDPYGESEVKIKSRTNGHIIGLNNMPVVHQGDALIHIGTA